MPVSGWLAETSAVVIDYTDATSMDVASSPYEFYYVTATDRSGNEGRPGETSATPGSGETPRSYVLSVSAYPNPFNPQTTIRYTVPSAGRVKVAIYDARGARVATLVDEEKAAGAYAEAWTGRDARGSPVTSGVYFARVSHPLGSRSYKIVLLK